MISGEYVPKMDENGRKPRTAGLGRPAGLAPLHNMSRLRSRGNVTRVQNLSEDWMSVWSDEPKGLSMDQRTHNQYNIKNNLAIQHPEATTNVKSQRRWNGGQHMPEGGWPAWPCLRWSYATNTDSRRRSQTSTQRRWPRVHFPRPASLGEAGWPHFEGTLVLASRGRQAQPLYLLATDATCFKCPEPTLEGYK